MASTQLVRRQRPRLFDLPQEVFTMIMKEVVLEDDDERLDDILDPDDGAIDAYYRVCDVDDAREHRENLERYARVHDIFETWLRGYISSNATVILTTGAMFRPWGPINLKRSLTTPILDFRMVTKLHLRQCTQRAGRVTDSVSGEDDDDSLRDDDDDDDTECSDELGDSGRSVWVSAGAHTHPSFDTFDEVFTRSPFFLALTLPSLIHLKLDLVGFHGRTTTRGHSDIQCTAPYNSDATKGISNASNGKLDELSIYGITCRGRGVCFRDFASFLKSDGRIGFGPSEYILEKETMTMEPRRLIADDTSFFVKTDLERIYSETRKSYTVYEQKNGSVNAWDDERVHDNDY